MHPVVFDSNLYVVATVGSTFILRGMPAAYEPVASGAETTSEVFSRPAVMTCTHVKLAAEVEVPLKL